MCEHVRPPTHTLWARLEGHGARLPCAEHPPNGKADGYFFFFLNPEAELNDATK